MYKPIFLIFALLLALSGQAQDVSHTAYRIIRGHPRPTGCNVGDVWVDDSTIPAVKYSCLITGTWSADGAGGGSVTSVAAGTGLTAIPSPIVGAGTISLSIPVAVSSGGTNAITAPAALVNLLPVGTRVGDILYCTTYAAGACSAWTLVAGNNSGTGWLQETSGGVASWTAPRLDQVVDPNASKSFTMGNYTLTFNFTANNIFSIISTGIDSNSMFHLKNVGVQGPFLDYWAAGGRWAFGINAAGDFDLRNSVIATDPVNGTTLFRGQSTGDWNFAGTFNRCTPGGSSGTAYTCTLPIATAPLVGSTITMLPDVDSGASPTLAVNGAAAAGIYETGGQVAVKAGELKAGKAVIMTFDAAGHWDVAGLNVPPFTPSGTQYAFTYYPTTTTNGSVPTVPNTKGKFPCGYNLATDAAAAPSCWQIGYASRGVTGTTSTDTILFTDNDVEYTGSVAVATALYTATTLENPAFAVQLSNHTTGSSTAVTVTPTTWQISKNGGTPGATLTIDQGQSCFVYVVPAGSAWDANCHNATLVAGTGISLTRAPDTLTIANTGVTGVTATSPVVSTGTTAPVISCPTCMTGPNMTLVGGIIGTYGGASGWAANRSYPWFGNAVEGGFYYATYIPFSAWINNLVVSTGDNAGHVPTSIGVGTILGGSSVTPSQNTFTILPGTAAQTVVSGIGAPPTWVPAGALSAAVISAAVSAGSDTFRGLSAQLVGTTSQLLGNAYAGVTVSTGATVYTGFSMSGTPTATEANVEVPIPYTLGATARNLCVYMATANAAGGNLVFTLRQGIGAAGAMADTLLVATVPLSSYAGDVYCDNFAVTGHAITLAQGDRIDVSIVNGNAGAASGAIQSISMELVPTGTSTGMIIWGTDGITLPAAGTTYGAPFTNVRLTAPSYVATGMPRAVTAKNLICYVTAAPLVQTEVMTVFKNGSGPGSGLVATAAVGDGVPEEVSDVAHTISFAAADSFSLQYLNASGGTAAVISSCSMEVD